MPADPRPGWETCPTCEGTGLVDGECPGYPGKNVSCAVAHFDPCPVCVRGERPGDRLLDVTAEAIKQATGSPIVNYAVANAALLAARREEGDACSPDASGNGGTPMGRRIVEIVELCEHGRTEKHCTDHPELAGTFHAEYWGYPPEGSCTVCPGGTSRTLTEGEYVLIEKVDGEWPDWANESLSDPPLYELSPSAQRELGGDGEAVVVKPRFILDALAGGEQP